MRVILNMATLRGQGCARVGKGVLEALGRTSASHHFLAFVPSQWDVTPFARYRNLTVHQVPNGWRGKILTDLWLIPRAIPRFRADRLFSLSNTSVFGTKVPHLLMVQQAYLAYKASNLSFVPPKTVGIKYGLMAILFRLSSRCADQITVQTITMQHRLCERWDLQPERVTVVPTAVTDFADVSDCAETKSSSQQQPYVCYIASPSPHKNNELMIEMLGEFARRKIKLQCHLTLKRQKSSALERRARELGVADWIVWRGTLEREEIQALLRGAEAMVMPSRLESYGLSYIEAMAVGCPVVASDLDFAHDVCEDAALYADPDSPQAFADQVQRVLQDKGLRSALQMNLRRRYRQIACTWDDVVRQYLSLLESIGPTN